VKNRPSRAGPRAFRLGERPELRVGRRPSSAYNRQGLVLTPESLFEFLRVAAEPGGNAISSTTSRNRRGITRA